MTWDGLLRTRIRRVSSSNLLSHISKESFDIGSIAFDLPHRDGGQPLPVTEQLLGLPGPDRDPIPVNLEADAPPSPRVWAET